MLDVMEIMASMVYITNKNGFFDDIIESFNRGINIDHIETKENLINELVRFENFIDELAKINKLDDDESINLTKKYMNYFNDIGKFLLYILKIIIPSKDFNHIEAIKEIKSELLPKIREYFK